VLFENRLLAAEVGLRPQRAHNFGTYFVSTQTWQRRSLFQATELAELFVRTLYHYREEGRYLLHDFVLMPTHVHLIITPIEITLERAMQLIKGGFSHAAGKTGRPGEIWQVGFTDHRIRDAEDYERHREYIRQNPVLAGRCEGPGGCPYSSAHSGYELDELPQRLKPEALAAERHG
jgi:putative transposase